MTVLSSAWTTALLIALPGLPAAVVFVLAVLRWATGRRAEEKVVAILFGVAFAGVTLASAVLAYQLFHTGSLALEADLGHWFAVGHYEFPLRLRGDRLSLPFALFTSILVGVIATFSRKYLHREDGFHRFYLLLGLFGAGVELVVLAGSLDLVFFGWEIVGLSSVLLIAFFHDRPKPVEHALRTFVTYRACDVGLLAAIVWMHTSTGGSSLTLADPSLRWPGLVVPSEARDALVVAFLLLWASIGKSAQLPLGGWLPRAMEGPTPSSAIFYGAISVHLGPYLLLRAAPVLEAAPIAAWAVVAVGLATALHATVVGRVQSDIKSALAYASMTQIGLIFVEIGLGLHLLALAHIVGHASIRSLQILRSPSLLHHHQHLEQAMGEQLPRTGGHLERLIPARLQPWLYRNALERGHVDALVIDWLVEPFLRSFRALDRWESHFEEWVGGEATPFRSAIGLDPLEPRR